MNNHIKVWNVTVMTTFNLDKQSASDTSLSEM